MQPELITGQMFALFIIVVAAAEATVGLAMVIAIYRSWQTIHVDTVDSLRG
jgi:NADH-quinone oxidoreductase subunit K